MSGYGEIQISLLRDLPLIRSQAPAPSTYDLIGRLYYVGTAVQF